MTKEEIFQGQIKAHKDSLISIINLVECGQWEAQEALDLGVTPTEIFHIRFIGGTKQTCDMMDDLFNAIIKAKKLCLDLE